MQLGAQPLGFVPLGGPLWKLPTLGIAAKAAVSLSVTTPAGLSLGIAVSSNVHISIVGVPESNDYRLGARPLGFGALPGTDPGALPLLPIRVTSTVGIATPQVIPDVRYGGWALGSSPLGGYQDLGDLGRLGIRIRSNVHISTTPPAWQLGIFQLGVWALPFNTSMALSIGAKATVHIALDVGTAPLGISLKATVGISLADPHPYGMYLGIRGRATVGLAFGAGAPLTLPIAIRGRVGIALSGPALGAPVGAVTSLVVIPKFTALVTVGPKFTGAVALPRPNPCTIGTIKPKAITTIGKLYTRSMGTVAEPTDRGTALIGSVHSRGSVTIGAITRRFFVTIGAVTERGIPTFGIDELAGIAAIGPPVPASLATIGAPT